MSEAGRTTDARDVMSHEDRIHQRALEMEAEEQIAEAYERGYREGIEQAANYLDEVAKENWSTGYPSPVALAIGVRTLKDGNEGRDRCGVPPMFSGQR